MRIVLSRDLPALLVFAGVALAQQQTGTIFGTVTDQQGAVVPKAQVEVVNVATAAVFRTQSEGNGQYTAPGLAVGQYEVRVQLKGFKTAVQSGLVLQVNQNARINIVLRPGEVRQTVEVVAEIPLVDTRSATLGQVVENRRIQELPLNGRQALALELFTTGVISNSTPGPLNSGFGDRGIALSSVSINGGPNAMNAQMLDGNNNTLTYYGDIAVPPAVDSVEEFKVQSGAMSAEFGFTAGGVVNLVTKSGTNQIHGTAYEFLRNDKLDARNTFSSQKLPLRYNQYGASLGGPIVKNKLFGFFNYEQYLLRQSSPVIASVPIQEWRNGDFSNLKTSAGQSIALYDPITTRANRSGGGQIRDPFPGNLVPKNRWDPVTPKILEFWPLPNKTPNNAFTQSQNYQYGSVTGTDWNQWPLKIDYIVSDRNSMFVRYTQAEHDLRGGTSMFTDPTVGPNRHDNQTNRNVMVSDTHTFSPTLINNLRVGIVRQYYTFRAVNGGQNWPQKLGLPATVPSDQFPAIDFGFGTIGGAAFGTRASLNWDIQNMVTKISGSHTFKVGVNARILQGGNQQGSALSGTYSFSGLTTNPQKTAGTGSSMAQFLLGEVSSASISRVLGNSWQGKAVSTFFQDDWRVSRRLTLNLGLRWDYQQKPYERHDGHIGFNANAMEPITGLPGITVYAGVNGQPRSFRNSDYDDLSPRFGFAFDAFGTGKTVFRGGYGVYYPSIFYTSFFGNTTLFSTTNTSYAAQGPNLAAFRFSEGLPFAPLESPGAAAGPSALLGQSVTLTESDGTTPLTQQWNASLQQQIGNWLVEVGYAGNKGNHLAATGYNLNQLNADLRLQLGQSLYDAVPNPNAGKISGGLGASTITRERLLMQFPQYDSVTIGNPTMGNYISHQLQVHVERRFKSGVLFNLAYTNGKRIGDSEADPVNFNLYQSSTGFQDGHFNRKVNRSIDPSDISQRGVIMVLYELPFGPGKSWNPSNAVLRNIVGGWQVNTVSVMQAGMPLVVRGASNYQADRPNSTGMSAKLDDRGRSRWFNTDAFVNPSDFTYGNVGRVLPDVRNPGIVNFDFSLFKNISITERAKLQFRTEAFNVLNHVNLGLVNATFVAGPDGKNSNASFGTITSAGDPRRIQLGLKLIF